MPIYYYKGLSLDLLAEQLSLNINSNFDKNENPLHSSLIVIPNTNIRTWLQLKIAKLQGVSLNLQFEFFESMILRYFFEKKGMVKDDNLFETKLSSHKKILSYLLNEKDSPHLASFSKYLNNISRAFSLSSKLRSLFDEYEYNRPNWIGQWATDLNQNDISRIGKNQYPLPDKSMNSKFQEKLYKDVFLNPKNLKTRSNPFLLHTDNHSSLPSRNFYFPSIHIFCLSNLSELYVQILEEISKKDSVNIYFYQFFTDIPANYSNEDKSSPLRWAKSQIYLAQKMEAIAEKTNFSEEISSKEPKLIQRSLAVFQEFLHAKASKQELQSKIGDFSIRESIQFWNAPSIYREVETVAHDILDKIQKSKKCKKEINFLDFSILVTDINLYRPAIEWVFDGGILLQESENSDAIRYKIPYSLTDLKGIDNSFLCKGILDLFQLCEKSQIRQKDILNIINNPIFGFINANSSIDEIAIKDLLLELGAYYEEDGRESDIFQISKAFQRLRLTTIYESDYLNNQIGIESINRYSDADIKFVSELWNKIQYTKKKIKESLSIKKLTKDSIQNIFFVLEEIFTFENEFEREASNLQEWYENVLEWEDFEYKNFEEGIEIIQLLTQSIFDKLPYRHGSFLIDGVSISLLQPMRPIPFEHVYILGLGEGKFPGKIDHSKLDLRKQSTQAWDSNKIEIQESLLWEALHSAFSSITLCYVGEDTKEQKVYEPCSHYFELMNSLGIHEATKIPLHSYSAKFLSENNSLPTSYDFTLRLLHDKKLEVNHLIPNFEIGKVEHNSEITAQRSSIHLSDLSRFLADPLDTYLKKQMGMYLDSEIVDEDGYEIFSLNALEDSALFKRIYPLMIYDIVKAEEWSWNEQKIATTVDRFIIQEQKNARFPQSVYSELQKQSMIQFITNASVIFQSWKSDLEGGVYFQSLSLGDTGLRSKSNETSQFKKLESLTIEIDSSKSYEILGEWENVVINNNKIYWICIGTLVKDFTKGDDNFIQRNARSFLSALSLSCLNEDLIIYSMKSRPKDSKDQSLKVKIQLARDLENNGFDPKNYLVNLIKQYYNPEPILFSTKYFQKYYTENISKLSDSNTIFQDTSSWKNYLLDNSEDAKSELSELTKLYPNVMDFLMESNPLDFAKKFFQPIIQSWKPIS